MHIPYCWKSCVTAHMSLSFAVEGHNYRKKVEKLTIINQPVLVHIEKHQGLNFNYSQQHSSLIEILTPLARFPYVRTGTAMMISYNSRDTYQYTEIETWPVCRMNHHP